ncbi:FAD-binding protein, partial [Enterococcus sp.]
MNKEEMITQFPKIALLKDEPLMNYTYTKTGGPADILAFPKIADEVKQLVDYCRNEGIPWLVLGNASNLIVRDGGIRGVVIMLAEMNEISVEGTTITAAAGAKLIDTTYVALHESLTGF